MQFIPVMAKLNYSSFQCYVILQKLFLYADLLLKKQFLLLSFGKTVVLLNIFVEMVKIFQDSLINRKFRRIFVVVIIQCILAE